MKQSRAMSLLETTLSTAAGFGISLAAQSTVLPLLGVTVSFTQNVAFAVVMTFVSIARQFGMRRLFEALHIRIPMTAAATAVLAERRRQIEAEGWTAEHDDGHAVGDLGKAAGAYALHASHWYPCLKLGQQRVGYGLPHAEWPWSRDWWKPQDFRRDLVRAGALILAEIERFDRTRKPRRSP